MAVKKEVESVIKFSKEQLMMAAVFANRRDVLGVVVGDGEEITVSEAKTRIEKFMKGKVN